MSLRRSSRRASSAADDAVENGEATAQPRSSARRSKNGGEQNVAEPPSTGRRSSRTKAAEPQTEPKSLRRSSRSSAPASEESSTPRISSRSNLKRRQPEEDAVVETVTPMEAPKRKRAMRPASRRDSVASNSEETPRSQKTVRLKLAPEEPDEDTPREKTKASVSSTPRSSILKARVPPQQPPPAQPATQVAKVESSIADPMDDVPMDMTTASSSRFELNPALGNVGPDGTIVGSDGFVRRPAYIPEGKIGAPAINEEQIPLVPDDDFNNEWRSEHMFCWKDQAGRKWIVGTTLRRILQTNSIVMTFPHLRWREAEIPEKAYLFDIGVVRRKAWRTNRILIFYADDVVNIIQNEHPELEEYARNGKGSLPTRHEAMRKPQQLPEEAHTKPNRPITPKGPPRRRFDAFLSSDILPQTSYTTPRIRIGTGSLSLGVTTSTDRPRRSGRRGFRDQREYDEAMDRERMESARVEAIAAQVLGQLKFLDDEEESDTGGRGIGRPRKGHESTRRQNMVQAINTAVEYNAKLGIIRGIDRTHGFDPMTRAFHFPGRYPRHQLINTIIKPEDVPEIVDQETKENANTVVVSEKKQVKEAEQQSLEQARDAKHYAALLPKQYQNNALETLVGLGVRLHAPAVESVYFGKYRKLTRAETNDEVVDQTYAIAVDEESEEEDKKKVPPKMAPDHDATLEYFERWRRSALRRHEILSSADFGDVTKRPTTLQIADEEIDEQDFNVPPKMQPDPKIKKFVSCAKCGQSTVGNRFGIPERIVRCSECKMYAHPTCMLMEASLVPNIRDYRWQCSRCKVCSVCMRGQNADSMFLCRSCDRGYHLSCLRKEEVEKIDPEDGVPDHFICPQCSAKCYSCGKQFTVIATADGAEGTGENNEKPQHQQPEATETAPALADGADIADGSGRKVVQKVKIKMPINQTCDGETYRLFCEDCADQFRKMHYCRICCRTYDMGEVQRLKDDESTPYLQCTQCEQYAHKSCDPGAKHLELFVCADCRYETEFKPKGAFIPVDHVMRIVDPSLSAYENELLHEIDNDDIDEDEDEQEEEKLEEESAMMVIKDPTNPDQPSPDMPGPEMAEKWVEEQQKKQEQEHRPNQEEPQSTQEQQSAQEQKPSAAEGETQADAMEQDPVDEADN
eukprot:Clim_evm28s206 gene=Clim_evmTU28s206